MASEWYYTTNKQQMGPVSWTELRELADVGILKAHDMVWSEGMDEWVKAINQDGLFAEGAGERPSRKAAYTDAKPPPGRRTRRREEEDLDDDEEDRKASKRKARAREQERAKMAVGVKIGLIIAGVLVVLVLGVSCIGGLIWITIGGGGAKKAPLVGGGNAPPVVGQNAPLVGGGNAPPVGGQNAPLGRQSYVVTNLVNGRQNDRTFNFTQGRRVVITVTNTNLQFPDTDVDLHVFRGNDPNPFQIDVRVPAQDRNCRLEFVVPANDSYIVRVRNLGPGNAGRCDVVVEEN